VTAIVAPTTRRAAARCCQPSPPQGQDAGGRGSLRETIAAHEGSGHPPTDVGSEARDALERYALLSRQHEDLARIHAQRERQMAFIVHDLKNPVASMDLHAQLVLRQGELPASTLIVVKGLFHPDFLLEIEGTAAV
jgi:signal transduction histidine kinase